ncbi:IDEAL domain-containing protein [Salinithrix halophila]|uniref:IDEAL domain-containing protein n=1 Tax=Salinithrix halophila TaxID=1485204 RepID=A0ABV8JFE1_9BACL
METLLNHPFQVGDWVKGKTENDELFQGYIESIDSQQGTIAVRVTQSDNTNMVGKVTHSIPDRIKYLEDTPLDQEGHFLNFIDLALTTKDKKWFMKLTDKLNDLRQQEAEADESLGENTRITG